MRRPRGGKGGGRTIASETKSLSLIVTVRSAFFLPLVRLGVPLWGAVGEE